MVAPSLLASGNVWNWKHLGVKPVTNACIAIRYIVDLIMLIWLNLLQQGSGWTNLLVANMQGFGKQIWVLENKNGPGK